jgi:release factor glutamine methyltransferase
VPDPQADARLLLCAAAEIDRATLITGPDRPLGAEAKALFDRYVARRRAREPVSRILRHREFWSLDLEVTPAVLDPRPDTETLIAAALAHLGTRRGDQLRILDLGAGSGAILCALLQDCPEALGWGVDRSPEACRVARRNLVRCGFAARSLVVCGDWGAALAAARFDLVLSNPPYIETAAIERLDPEVRLHDPHAALDGGWDGLQAYRLIARQAPALVAPGGAIFLEVGAGQAGAVAALLQGVGLQSTGTARDLAGIERVVGAVHPSLR